MTNFTAQYLTECAIQALQTEINLAPKPGLVDPISNGAHHDMTVATFEVSIHALTPYFTAYAQAGAQHQGNPRALFETIRSIGKQAEAAMLQATNGINTHKGANFSFAILLAAIAHVGHQSTVVRPFIRQMTQHLIAEDFSNLNNRLDLSYGERLYQEYGLLGVRGEAVAGYPALFELALPYAQQLDINDSTRWQQVLVYLMSHLNDSNIIHRGGQGALATIQSEMQALLAQHLRGEALLNALADYDVILTQRYLSPGGSADLLALTIFLETLYKAA